MRWQPGVTSVELYTNWNDAAALLDTKKLNTSTNRCFKPVWVECLPPSLRFSLQQECLAESETLHEQTGCLNKFAYDTATTTTKKTWSMNCYKATTVTSSVTDAWCVCYLFSSYLVFILKYTLLRNTCRGKDVSFCDPDPSFDELHHCFLDELWVFALLLLVAVPIDAQMTVTNNHCPDWMTPKQLSKMCNLLDFFAQ